MPNALHLITTCQPNAARLESLKQLVQSIERAAAHVPDAEIRHHILLQQPDLIDWKIPAPTRVTQKIHACERKLSLSCARNIILEKIIDEIGAGDIVAFPDDDCWYEPGTLEAVLGQFNNPEVGLVLASESVPDGEMRRFCTPSIACRRATSNVIFVSGRVALSLEGFNEKLGVGAKFNGGEDIDYALRAFSNCTTAVFMPDARVRHREPDPKKMRGPYFPGSCIALISAARRDPRFIPHALRKVLIGMYYAALGELSMSKLLGSVAEGFHDTVESKRRLSLSGGATEPAVGLPCNLVAEPSRAKSVEEVIVIAASPGGHLSQARSIVRLIDAKKHLVTSSSIGLESDRAFADVHILRNTRYGLITHLKNLAASFRILRQVRPILVVSTGGPFTIPVLIASRLSGIYSIYVDTISRVWSPSMTAKVVSRLSLSDELLVQWPHHVKVLKGSRFHGALIRLPHDRDA